LVKPRYEELATERILAVMAGSLSIRVVRSEAEEFLPEAASRIRCTIGGRVRISVHLDRRSRICSLLCSEKYSSSTLQPLGRVRHFL